MDIRKLFAAVTGLLSERVGPDTMQRVQSLAAQTPDDAEVDGVVNQLTAIWAESAGEHKALADACQSAGLTSAQAIQEAATNSKLGIEARQSLMVETLAAGVKAFGEGFDKERYTRLFANATFEDLRAERDRFNQEAVARLGPGGRQTTPDDPNAPPAGGALSEKSEDEQKKTAEAWGK